MECEVAHLPSTGRGCAGKLVGHPPPNVVVVTSSVRVRGYGYSHSTFSAQLDGALFAAALWDCAGVALDALAGKVPC